MKIALTGSSGLIGSALSVYLQAGGHQVFRLLRAADPTVSTALLWSVEKGVSDVSRLDGIDAVVHLAGENIAAGRWTKAQKQRLWDSRVRGTESLCRSLAGLRFPPKIFVGASAIGFYGNRGGENLTEESAAGAGFLPDLCRAWEAAADPIRQKGARVVHLRFGLILSSQGGALGKMLLPFKMGVGGCLGNGEQFYSWVALDDAVGSIAHALTTASLSGPVNVVSPRPVTNREFTKTLGRVLRRPTLFPVPAPVARLAFGEMADELLLSSTKVLPARLQSSGYQFQFPELERAFRHLLGR